MCQRCQGEHSFSDFATGPNIGSLRCCPFLRASTRVQNGKVAQQKEADNSAFRLAKLRFGAVDQRQQGDRQTEDSLGEGSTPVPFSTRKCSKGRNSRQHLKIKNHFVFLTHKLSPSTGWGSNKSRLFLQGHLFCKLAVLAPAFVLV